MPRLIRALDPLADLALVAALYREAADFWILSDRKPPDLAKAQAFFTDGPPGCDSAAAHRLGLFDATELVGVAELSFGFPEPADGYLGLMLFAPRARGRGHGPVFLAEIERLARTRDCPRLCLAVLQENARARAFWEGQGFRGTGVSRFDDETGHWVHRLAKDL
ncbi:GNAT family N-acetyltransferase [Tabrizicola oligotrophica]|uniref:GNAT family N-acetyltransferase n=1 Tax=Tabrizicola oligotrophica TaxID=2710650 RepID=UPI001D11B8BD|nr:GNAT family N-acetyltransferase [Tabrizicola oligotrophica]